MTQNVGINLVVIACGNEMFLIQSVFALLNVGDACFSFPQELAVPTVVDYKVDSVVDMVVDMVVDLVVDWGAIIHMPAVSMPPPWKPPEPNAALQ